MQTNISAKKSQHILGLVIVDGVGYRNFILSDFVNQSLNTFDEVVIFSGLPSESFGMQEQSNVRIIELPVFQESGKTWFWRKAKEVAHMQLHKDNFAGIDYNLQKNYPNTKSKRALITKVIFKITSVFHSEKWINRFYRYQVNSFKKNEVTKLYSELLKREEPDLLFFTHQRPPYLAPLDYAAKELGIKTCSFIFSWDNLPSKGRMAAPFDSFLVWSDLMKKELHYFYPETKNQSVEVVGTPQFEPYVLDRYTSSKEDFHQKFELDPGLKTICYSCGDASTSKNDPVYIEVIAKLIKQIKLTENINFLVRTSPAEDGSRFREVVNRFPFIKWNYPKWKLTRKDHPEPWSQRVPLPEDLIDLRSLLEYCDLNINMCSTMSLDFMLFDKPVINPNFGTEENDLYDDQKYLQYSHYERVVQSGAVATVKNEEELLREINFSLNNPEARIKEQKELLKLQIGKPLEETSQRITETLKEFSEA
ncbi:hypothetical protein GCM10007103_33900 [Salinimicrobium marinum]|uniref:CDP-Glycerol:Poly(Glycerophosphate) glycerophosphotransferase n=1 Tax=Salinimicrobium marinum TaxID=680283 RepID=A0A918SLN8_9FLAO|nr:hypothetical protein [Salinimicrobium marinum]GHA50364.1 hypothetical protein GCM10007103_33900 [Salinimicrobium marinum]